MTAAHVPNQSDEVTCTHLTVLCKCLLSCLSQTAPFWSEGPLSYVLWSHLSVSRSTTIHSIICSSTLPSEPLCQLEPRSFCIQIAPSLYLFYITLHIQVFQDNCFFKSNASYWIISSFIWGSDWTLFTSISLNN